MMISHHKICILLIVFVMSGITQSYACSPLPPEPSFSVGRVSYYTANDHEMIKFDIGTRTRPKSDVTLRVSSSNVGLGMISRPENGVLTFEKDKHTTHTVSVRGVTKGMIEREEDYFIVTHPAKSKDPEYNGLNPGDVLIEADVLKTWVDIEKYNFIVGKETSIPIEINDRFRRDNHQYFLLKGPSGMEIERDSISWTPAPIDNGKKYDVVVKVEGNGKTSRLHFKANVASSFRFKTKQIDSAVEVVDGFLAGARFTAYDGNIFDGITETGEDISDIEVRLIEEVNVMSERPITPVFEIIRNKPVLQNSTLKMELPDSIPSEVYLWRLSSWSMCGSSGDSWGFGAGASENVVLFKKFGGSGIYLITKPEYKN